MNTVRMMFSRMMMSRSYINGNRKKTGRINDQENDKIIRYQIDTTTEKIKQF